MAKLPIAPHPIPQASLCSCVPSAASAPTASSSPGPGSRAPPHLRSPSSLPHIHVLAGQREAGGEIRSRSYSNAPGPQLPSQQRGGRGGGGSWKTPKPKLLFQPKALLRGWGELQRQFGQRFGLMGKITHSGAERPQLAPYLAQHDLTDDLPKPQLSNLASGEENNIERKK